MPRLPDIDDVLAGRARVDLGLLVTLIHSVNPTDRGLPAREEASRYARKAALQSLLLRRFPDQVVPRQDARDEDLCTLHVPLDGRDAGHARISALDEDLRPTVRSLLAAPATRPAASPRPDATRGAKAAAIPDPQRLVDDGDLAGGAEAWLTLAVGGDVRAAREALVLWVDWMDEADRARHAWATLPREVRADAVCRALLARAEVRSGAFDAAERLLGAERGAEVGAVWRELAEGALAAGDADRARRGCQRMIEADPGTRQAALALEGRLAAIDAASRAPLRSAVDDAATEADTLAALAALEAAFPADRHAARVRARIAAQRTEAAEERRLADARSAHEARIRSVRDALRADIDEDALVGWLSLPDADRAAASAGIDAQIVGMAAEMDARHPDRARAVSRAALAVAASDGCSPTDIVALLAPHGDLLVGVARRRLVEARRTLELARQERAAELLADAVAALAGGDLAGARTRMACVPRVDLAPDQREVMRRHSEALERLTAEAAAEAEFESLIGREPWRARDAANARGPSWRHRVDRATTAVHAAVGFRDLGASGSIPVVPHVGAWAHDGRAIASIDEDGSSLLLCEPLGRHLAVHRASVPELAPIRSVVFRLPNPSWTARLAVRGGTAWVETSDGLLLALDAATLAPLRWTRVPESARLEVLDDGIWVLETTGAWTRLDLATLQSAPAGRLEPARGVPGGDVLLRTDTNVYSVRTQGGVRTAGKVGVAHQSRTVATDGRRLLVAAGLRGSHGAGVAVQLWLLEDGQHRILLDLGPVPGAVWLAMDADTGYAAWIDEGAMRAVAVDLAARSVRWRAELPGDTLFFQAPSGGRVAALVLGAEHGELHWLDEGPARIPGRPAREVGMAVEIQRRHTCDVDAADADADPAVLRAQERYAARDWDGVARATADARVRTDHVLHLEGMAALLQGDVARAEGLLLPFTRRSSACDVRYALPVCGAIFANADPKATGADARAQGVLRDHARCAAAADAALEAGDFAAAWAALDDPPSWHADCAQLAGRRLAAVLGMDERNVLRLLRALGSFERATGDVPGIPSWPTARLTALTAEARERIARDEPPGASGEA